MSEQIARAYYRATLDYPFVVIALVLLLLVAAAHQAQHFRLDASSDSLVLENDADLLYDREIRARYGSDEFLVVTYNPRADLFSDDSLATLDSLSNELAALDRVSSVLTMLDVPLLDSPRQTFSDVTDGVRTLRDDDVDRALARQEFLSSPLYRDLLLNRDADTTAILVTLERDEQAYELLVRRDDLRLKRAEEGLTAQETVELERVTAAYAARNAELQAELEEGIERVRAILDGYRNGATIFLGGVPMIAADMIAFVRGDIRTFGVGVALFIVVLLAVAFRRPRWVIVPVAICAGVVVGMIGFLGLVSWPVTVVSSNFISLILILTLSLIVHLVVRHRELHSLDPAASQVDLLRGTIDSKFKPSFFTALTTMVSFASLMFADIRPVMDFGNMMVVAIVVAFVLTFTLFPALLARVRPGGPSARHRDLTRRCNLALASLVERRPVMLSVVFVVAVLLSLGGMARLQVENRFIDYFKSDTEIHQGMVLIDRELGGTTPLDVVLDAPADFLASSGAAAEHENDEWDDEWSDDFYLEEEEVAGPADGYWFNEYGLREIAGVHEWLESLPESGKVISLGTTRELSTHLNEGEPLDSFELAVMHRRLPDELHGILIDPYLSADGDQTRLTLRVIDSDPELQRNALLERIERGLIGQFDLEPDQVNLSGMLVLYNNVMQSLFRSQFVTMFIVFGAIMVMLGFLFRSVKMGLIGPLPTLVSACAILGIMGWASIPLDIMTITIAAITIGIGVDDTIHYTDRFRDEFREHGNYDRAVRAAHGSVGQALVYTTLIIVLGFSVLALSNFIPTIYFGLLTGLAMILALLTNLTLLPLLLRRVRPFGPARVLS